MHSSFHTTSEKELKLGLVYLTQVMTGIDRSLAHMVAVWCSGNALLVLINAVALHRARLVLGWVTAFEYVNYLTM